MRLLLQLCCLFALTVLVRAAADSEEAEAPGSGSGSGSGSKPDSSINTGSGSGSGSGGKPDQLGLFAIARYDSSPEAEDPEGQIKERICQWLNKLAKDGLEDKCSEIFGRARRNTTATLVSPADSCSEEGASEFTFSGGPPEGGLPEGRGVLRRRGAAAAGASGPCLRFGSLFGSRVEEIRAEFRMGVPHGKAVLKWRHVDAEGNKKKKEDEGSLVAEVFLDQGVPHGMFKVVARPPSGDKVWTVGNVRNGQVTLDCWVVTKTEVRVGNCTDPFVFRPDVAMLVLERQPVDAADADADADAIRLRTNTVSVAGLLARPGAEVRELRNASDYALLELLSSEHGCLRQAKYGRYAHKFIYDLETKQRKYKTFDPDALLCQGQEPVVAEGREPAARLAREFMSNLTLERVMGFPVEQSVPLDPKRARKLLTHVESIEGNRYEAVLNLFNAQTLEFRYQGDKDEDGVFHGYGLLQIAAKVSCLRSRCQEPDYATLAGHFEHGVLQGPVALASKDNRQTTGLVVKDGVVHGLVMTLGIQPIYPYPEIKNRQKNSFQYNFIQNGVGLVARFLNGKVTGKIWRGMIGEPDHGPAFLYGPVKKNSLNMTGDDIAYLYPYLESALVGRFEDNYMRAGRYTHIRRAVCHERFLGVEFDPVDEDAQAYEYDPPNNETVSKQPLLQDPYELETVVVQKSLVPGAGEGLYARRDLRPHQLVALYAGLIYGEGQIELVHNHLCKAAELTDNPCDKYSISTHKGGTILIPTPLNDTAVYCATTAWKVNNAFEPDTHLYFHDMEHPRFGLIIGVSAYRQVRAGEELLVDYQYGDGVNDTTSNHQWYYQARREHMAKMEERKKEEEEEEKKKIEATRAKDEL